MANIQSSKKDIRRIKKRRAHNVPRRTRLRSFDKKIRSLVTEGKLEEARKTFQAYSQFLDRAGRRHLIHPGQADRRKSRMATLLNKAAKAS